MAYVPQFIETDLGALQGIMNQSQAKYDYNTAQSDAMSSKLAEMSATNTFDQQQKDLFRNKLKEEVARLDKQYNYDRSSGQYAKELTTSLNNIKSDPYFGYKVKADKLEEQRRAMQLQMKGDYFETTKPFDEKLTTLADRQKALDEWGVLSLKDLETGVTKFGEGYAAGDYQGVITDPTLVEGYTRVMNQLGARNMGEAAKILRESDALLNQAVKGTGFEGHMDDPKVKDRAINALLSSMVGKQTDQWLREPAGDGSSSSGGGGKGPMLPTNTISSQSAGEFADPYAAKSLGETDNINERIAKLDILINDRGSSEAQKAEFRQEKFRLQRDMEDIIALRTRVEKSEPQVFNVGRQRITSTIADTAKKEGIPLVAGTGAAIADDIMELWRDHFTETNWAQRISTKNKNTELVPQIYEMLAKGHKFTPAQEKEAVKLANELAKQGREWYKGFGNWTDGLSYEDVIQKQVDKQLGEGKRAQWDVTAPAIEPTSAEYGQVLNSVLLSLRHTMPMEQDNRKGEGVEWDSDKLAEAERYMRLPGTSINFMFDNKNRAYIQLHNPGAAKTTKDGKEVQPRTVTVRIDPERSSYDYLVNLARVTGERRFLDVAYKDVDLVDDKRYFTDSKDGELKKMLGTVPAFRKEDQNTGEVTTNLEGLEGISVKAEVQPDNSVKYKVYLDDKDDIADYAYSNQVDMIKGLKGLQLQTEQDNMEATQRMSQMDKNAISPLVKSKSLDEYKAAIKRQETKGQNIENLTGSGATGYYQFMPDTIKGMATNGLLKWSDEDINYFFDPKKLSEDKNKQMQEEAMDAYMTGQINTIKNLGYTIDPNNLTNEAKALLAATHYSSPEAVRGIINKRPWIFERKPQRNPRTGEIMLDRNGDPIMYPSIAEYIKKALGIDVRDLKFS